MIDSKHIKMVYFLGIGGIGMSAIARYFHTCGMKVYGYDKTSTQLTNELEKQGMKIHFEDKIENLPNEFNTLLKEEVLIIFTPAIPHNHKQKSYLLEQGFELKKRSQVLGDISASEFTIAIAGTHGKTTTSSMVSWILHQAGLNVTAFLGGIASNFNSNYVPGDRYESNHIIVLEADEYDRSFLTLNPDISVITSMDADHLDIYGEEKELARTYIQFAGKLKPEGKLFFKNGLEINRKKNNSEYGLDNSSSYRAENIRVENGYYYFDYVSPESKISNIKCGLGGRHNVENAVAACAIAQYMGLTSEKTKSGIESFKGVKRRFETVYRSKKTTYIDDYAHHPTELNAAINSVRELYPGKKITGIFQPHLFSRTRDFAEGFRESLSKLDYLILLEIYPARELPIQGVDASIILPRSSKAKTSIVTNKEDALEHLFKIKNEVILTLGAGNIDTLVDKIRLRLVAEGGPSED